MMEQEAGVAVCALTLLLVAAGTPVGSAVPLTQPWCEGATEPIAFAADLDRLENLAFDGAGHLYVASIDGDLRRFTPNGAFEVIATADLPLGGLAFGPDGALYLGVSVGFPTPLPYLGLPLLVQSGASEVWRFHSLFPPAYAVYVDGLDSANGMALDDAGNLYVGEIGPSVLRVPPGGGAFEAWADVPGVNGLTVTPDRAGLFGAVTTSVDSRIERIALADPRSVTTVASLSGLDAVVPKGLDDLDVGSDGKIYVTGHVSGEVLRVDAATGDACLLANGLTEPSAAALAHGFGSYDDSLFVTTFDGKLLVIPLGG